MGKNGFLGLVLLAVVVSAGALAGCGEEPVPLYPDYDTDVAPLMFARCVRCHGAGGTLNDDPDVTGKTVKALMGKPLQGYFDCMNDRGDCSPGSTTCKRGLRYYANDMEGAGTAAVWLKDMPPDPAPALTSREAAILKAWLAHPTPSAKTCQ
jgi:hypothetical protein